MASKRDLQLIRLACRRRWLTAEQGEDCLFLKRKLGDKLTIEQILRQRRYLTEEEIAELAAAAGVVGHRRPSLAAHRPTPATSVADPTTSTDPVPRTVDGALNKPVLMRPVSAARRPSGSKRLGDEEQTLLGTTIDPLDGPKTTEAQPIDFEALAAATGADDRPEQGEPTRFEPGWAGEQQPSEKTVIASLEEIQAAGGVIPGPPAGDDATVFDLPLAEVLARSKAAGYLRPDGPVHIDAPKTTLDSPPINPDASSDAATVAVEAVAPALPVPTARPEAPANSPEATAAVFAEQVGAMTGIYPRIEVIGSSARPAAIEPIRDAAPDPSLTLAGTESLFDPVGGDQPGAFGAYEVHYLVARGLRSTVYRATHIDTQRDIALKVLLAPGRAAAAFISERGDDLVRAAQLDHPRIVRVLDVGHISNRYYVALEYAAGWALSDAFAAGEQMTLAEGLRVAHDVATGLAMAEGQNVIHGDVRPGQIIVDDARRARLTGFGFHSVFRGRRGAPGYMAPEVVAGAAPSSASDQFSLGAVLFQLVAGRPAYEARTDDERWRLSKSTEPPDPRLYRPDLPKGLAQIILRLMARDPRDRFERFADVVAALETEREAAQIAPELDGAADLSRSLAAQALLGALALMLVALGVPLALDLLQMASLRSGGLASPVALAAALALVGATVIQAVVGLIRRGELPLPQSSALLVRGQELLGLLGATLLVAGFAVSPPAFLNLGLAVGGALLLSSGLFGSLLRRAIASARGEGSVGRVLGILGDARLVHWRHWHVPGLTAVAAVATVRWMALAYFAAS